MFSNRLLVNACKQMKSFSYVTARHSSNIETNNIEKTINQVTLLGRVGADPQKRGNEEHPVVVFSLATHLNYKYDKNDIMQKTDWHRVCVFKPNLRETAYNYLRKGQRVMVNGRISYGEIKSDEGTSKMATSIIADDIIFFQ
ncbi:single-stranded DNA-binding protein, mitochondrial [Trichogramma pretiosum]|uniref:single-stranded DNA-binding protein, mitochondrial n=1 Tax=Trichogramma pretiosum TaxID=7493 RepID=UPI0006C9C451|nr:single-stranded DNA-binding protein, mitochondrial [Trichogramma pretiosum]